MTTLTRAERRARRLYVSKHQSGHGTKPGGGIRRFSVQRRTADLQARMAAALGITRPSKDEGAEQ